MKRGADCLEKWNQIPDDTDILVTHGPALGYGDLCSSQMRAGCAELLSTIQNRVKPMVHVFGHIHEGIHQFYILEIVGPLLDLAYLILTYF